jgi:phosphopantetheine--protein transferase-like protein
MLALGIDAVEIERCQKWSAYSIRTLQRLFSLQEITYCLSMPHKAAERFAVRFAAKEALYKAICHAFVDQKISFLRLCRLSEVTLLDRRPAVYVDWQALGIEAQNISIAASLTHTKSLAIASVVIFKVSKDC